VSKKSRNLDKAVEAFGQLPAEVAALGEPLSVHPPSAAARMLGVKLTGLKEWLADPVQERKRAAVMAIVMPVLGVGILILYLSGIQLGDLPRVALLIAAGVGVLLGVLAGGYWWYLSQKAPSKSSPPPPDPEGSMPGFIFYPDALVQVRDDKFTVIRWKDVQTLDGPGTAPYWRITARDGRQIQLSYWVEDEATTIETIIARVTAVLLPQFLQRIASGDKVMFGPFGISKLGVCITKTSRPIGTKSPA